MPTELGPSLAAKILAHRVKPQQPVSSLMFTSFRQVAPSAPLAALSHVFKRHSFCLVVSTDERFKKKAVVGVCTPIDLLKFVVDDKGKLPSHSASRQEAYPIATEPARQAEETARDLGCSAYIWSAIKHKKTPVNSPFSSPVVRAMEAPMPPKLQLDELERAAATPIGGTCPTQMGGTGGFDCAGYVWGFVKNKTPIASPMPSLKSSPMNSPAVAATTGVGAVPAMPTV